MEQQLASGPATVEAPAAAATVTPAAEPNRVVALLRRVPYTTGVVVAMIVVGLATTAFWRDLSNTVWWDRLAYGLPALRDGRVWTPITGSLLAEIPTQYIPIGAVVIFGIGLCEWRLGTRTAALASIGGQLFGVLGAALLLWLLSQTSWAWADARAGDLDVGFSAGALCCLTVVAFNLKAPWRGRFLVVIFAYCLVNLLYVGLIWDVEHLLAALLGLAIGWRMAPRTVEVRALTHHEARIVAATLFVFLAVADLFAALYPENGPLGALDRGSVHPVAVAVDIVVELAIAGGLHRGSRLAWRLAVAWCALGLVGALFTRPPGRAIVGVLLTGAVLLLLIRTRRAYTARVAGMSRNRLIRDVVAILVASAAYVFIGFATIKDFRPRPTAGQKVDEVFSRLFLGTSGEFAGTSRDARAFLDSLSFIPLAIAATFLVVLFLRTRKPRSALDRDKVVALLKQYGGSNLSWMTTWPRNTYFVTADGKAVVTYQLYAGTAIVLGDPAGDPAALPNAMDEFAAYCEHQGYLPCVFSCTDATIPAADRLGWKYAQIAEDTVIDLPDLEFKGKKWQDIRTALNKAGKSGVSFRMGRLRDQPFAIVQQARGISDQWVSDKGMPEMGFTLGTIDEALDPEVLVGLAIDDDGNLQGITSWLPVFGPGGTEKGWTLDVMRRHPNNHFRPVVEYMIASSCLAFKQRGALTVSLSGAPLARSDETAELTGMDTLLDTLGRTLEPWYGFRSLHKFKTKFLPRYEPMYLCYPDETALPRIGVALTRAYLPDARIRDFATMLRNPGGGE
jgi:phosphatidylglycerol lysyltransferase